MPDPTSALIKGFITKHNMLFFVGKFKTLFSYADSNLPRLSLTLDITRGRVSGGSLARIVTSVKLATFVLFFFSILTS